MPSDAQPAVIISLGMRCSSQEIIEKYFIPERRPFTPFDWNQVCNTRNEKVNADFFCYKMNHVTMSIWIRLQAHEVHPCVTEYFEHVDPVTCRHSDTSSFFPHDHLATKDRSEVVESYVRRVRRLHSYLKDEVTEKVFLLISASGHQYDPAVDGKFQVIRKAIEDTAVGKIKFVCINALPQDYPCSDNLINLHVYMTEEQRPLGHEGWQLWQDDCAGAILYEISKKWPHLSDL